MPKRKNVGESAKESAKPALVVQPNGKGALATGGYPGNKGGGRPKNLIRRRALESLKQRMKIADEIIDDDEAKDRDRIMGLAFLHKVSGMEQKGAVTVDAELLNEFFTVIEFHIQDDVVLAEIRENWLDILAARVGA